MGSNRIIINAAIGGNYMAGQRRLHRSLVDQGYTGDVGMFDQYPVDGYDTNNPYTVKASSFENVLVMKKYRFIVWMDATAVAVKNVDPLFERIEERGYYLASSGYSAAETSTDIQLAAAYMSREEAASIPDAATGCIGIDTTNAKAMEFITQWIAWAKDGLFGGSRLHSKADSQHPLFKFGRQDQSAASLIAGTLEMSLDHLGGLTTYWPPNKTAVMAYKGIQ